MKIGKREMAVLAGGAVLAYLLMAKGNKALGWWQSMPGISSSSQQAAMLAQQDAEFYRNAYSAHPAVAALGGVWT